SWVTRTYLFDQLISEQIQEGVDLVINLAAGLDTRPYRMALPPSLRWVEVDLPDLLAYKQEVLAGEKPLCALERIALDLSNLDARRQLFNQLGRRARNALILSEGFLIYLSRDEVEALAADLSGVANFRSWSVDMASPAL